QVYPVQAAAGCRSQLSEWNKPSGWSVIEKQMLEALNAVRIGKNPIAPRSWKVAVVAVKFRCPEKLLCGSSPVVFEHKIALTRRSAGKRVTAEIQDVLVILPGMMAWNRI